MELLLPEEDYEPLPSIHPPRLIVVSKTADEDEVPPSPLSTPPNTPKRSSPPRAVESSPVPRAAVLDLTSLSPDKNNNEKNNDNDNDDIPKSEIPFDEGDELTMLHETPELRIHPQRSKTGTPVLLRTGNTRNQEPKSPPPTRTSKTTLRSSPTRPLDPCPADEPGLLLPRQSSHRRSHLGTSPIPEVENSSTSSSSGSTKSHEGTPINSSKMPTKRHLESRFHSLSVASGNSDHQRMEARMKPPSAADTVPTLRCVGASGPFDEGRDEIFHMDSPTTSHRTKKTAESSSVSRSTSPSTVPHAKSPVVIGRRTNDTSIMSERFASPTRASSSCSPKSSRSSPMARSASYSQSPPRAAALAFFPTQAIAVVQDPLPEDELLKETKGNMALKQQPAARDGAHTKGGPLGMLLDDAAYFSSTAAAATLTTMEDLILGPAPDFEISNNMWKGKTPDEMVTEWKKHRNRLKERSGSNAEPPQVASNSGTIVGSNEPKENTLLVGRVVPSWSSAKQSEPDSTRTMDATMDTTIDDPILRFRLKSENGATGVDRIQDSQPSAVDGTTDGSDASSVMPPPPRRCEMSDDAIVAIESSHSDDSSVPPPPPTTANASSESKSKEGSLATLPPPSRHQESSDTSKVIAGNIDLDKGEPVDVPQVEEVSLVSLNASALARTREQTTNFASNHTEAREPDTEVDPILSEKNSVGSSSVRPAMVRALDDARGIPTGDIFISLLRDADQSLNSVQEEKQVRAAVLRMRSMRKRQNEVDGRIRPKQRSALPVDVDEIRVVNSTEHIQELEANAHDHLERDELEEAWELYEEIIQAYRDSFLDEKSSVHPDVSAAFDFRPYIGTALHNIGILHFLNGSKDDFGDALRYFEQARDNRKSSLGETSTEYLTTMSRVALCHYALGDLQSAQRELEAVVELSKRDTRKLADFIQISEVLNTLGCISFRRDKPEAALLLFKDAFDIQKSVLNESLYSGPRLLLHDTNLRMSIILSNIGYVQLVNKNTTEAANSFELALGRQSTLLNSAHHTALATMDHLALANLYAGYKEKTVKMLTRICNAQLAEYGPRDSRVMASRLKLNIVTRNNNIRKKEIERVWTTIGLDARNASPNECILHETRVNRGQRHETENDFRL